MVALAVCAATWPAARLASGHTSLACCAAAQTLVRWHRTINRALALGRGKSAPTKAGVGSGS
eukprot:111023-Lingulodinium_polyedra.AAC.1